MQRKLKRYALITLVLSLTLGYLFIFVQPAGAQDPFTPGEPSSDNSMYLPFVNAPPGATVENEQLTAPLSSEPPTDYVPNTSQDRLAQVIGGADILLVQTSLPWNSYANTQVLTALGYTYDIIDMNSIGSVDIFRYPVMLIVNDQVQAFYDRYAQQISLFEDYVTNGGTLVFFAASDGWAGGRLRSTLPGGVRITTPWYKHNNYITNSAHPIINGGLSDGVSLSDADLYSNYCSHGYFSSLAPGTRVILREQSNYPTLIEYQLGLGRVIASTLTWEHNWQYHTGADSYGTFARKALDDLFLYAFSQSGVIDGLFYISPSAVPADGVTVANVTLAGATPGHRIRISSDRGNVDMFSATTGVADPQGRFATTVRSSIAGTVVLSAKDLSTNQIFPATARLNFVTVNGNQPELPPNQTQPIEIKEVRPQHSFASRFLEGISTPNRVDVVVDWRGSTPGRVEYILNDRRIVVTAGQSKTSYVIDMGKDLRPGVNELRIVAYNTLGQQSLPSTYRIYQLDRPLWMSILQAAGALGNFVLDGPISLGREHKTQFNFPPNALTWKAPIGPPNSEFEMGFFVGGSARMGIECSEPFILQVEGGTQPKLDLMGVELGGELKGSGSASAGIVECQIPTVEGVLRVDILVYGQKNWPVLTFIVDFIAPGAGTSIENTLRSIGLYKLLTVLGELYLQGNLSGFVESGLRLQSVEPIMSWKDARVGGGPGLETGYQLAQLGAEFKVYLGANGEMAFASPGPLIDLSNLAFDSVTIAGQAGWQLKPPLFDCKYGQEYEVEWSYAPSHFESTLMEEWECKIGWWKRQPSVNYAIFRGGSEHHQAFAVPSTYQRATGVNEQGTLTSLLVSNVYTYAEPALAINPVTGQALSLWVHDDVMKAPGQSHEIYSSVWDDTAWSQPQHVTNDLLLDGMPQVAWINETTAVAVWARLNQVQSDSATWSLATGRKIEIASSTYDAQTGRWSPVFLLTQNDALDLSPVLATSNTGDVFAAWRQNQSGYLSGDKTHPDQILTARWNGAGWDTPEVAVTGINGLVEISLANHANQAILTWTSPVIPNGESTSTLQLFTSRFDGVQWSEPVQLTNSPEHHTRPQVVYRQGQPYVIWIADGVLTLQSMDALTAQTLDVRQAAVRRGVAIQLESEQQVDQFRVLQDSGGNLFAVFTGQLGNQRDIFLSYFDATLNVWGESHAITDDRAIEKYPATGLDGEDRLLMVYARTTVQDEERSATLDDGQAVTFTVPVENQTDLYTLSHTLRRDVAVESLAISNHWPLPGDEITVTVVVANLGDVPLADINFAFQDNGVDFDRHILVEPLVAGQVVTLTLQYSVPVGGGQRILSAMADPDRLIAEIDETNNRRELTAFGSNMYLAGIDIEAWGGGDIDLAAHVVNLGTTDTPTATLVYQFDAFGSPIASSIVPPIAAGGSVELSTPWNTGQLEVGEYRIVGNINPAAADFPELDVSNNTYTATLRVGPDLMVSPHYLAATNLTASTVAVTTTVFNIGTTSAANVVLGIYNRGTLEPTTQIQMHTLAELNPGEFAVFTDTFSGPLGCGVYVQASNRTGSVDVSTTNNVAYLPAQNGRCASFYNTPMTAIAPATIAFTDTSTGNNTGWLWNFGDGSASTEQNPVHTFTNPGLYTVTLQVNSDDASDQYSLSNAVRVYQAVHADFVASTTSGIRPLSVTFQDRSAGDISIRSWGFGDGDASSLLNPTHVFDKAGVFTVTLTASGLGGTSIRTAIVTVAPFGPPTALTLTATPASLLADGASTATLTAVVKDANGNAVPNQTVIFATTLGAITNATVTNADGVATATLTSVQQVGVAQMTASLGSLSASTEVTFAGSMFAGVVFVDRNQNGVRDAGEPGIPNVTAEMTLVSLAASSEQAAAVGATWRTVSDAEGNYRFTNLPLGEYTLKLYFPRGYAATTPTTYTVTVGTGQSAAPEVGALVKVYLPSVRR